MPKWLYDLRHLHLEKTFAMDRAERFSLAGKVIAFGFWINAFLMVMKLLAGHLGNSEAVFADGLESACDFVAIFFTLIALKIGRRPFDEKHPYGHGKAESIAAVLISLIIFLTGCGIIYSAVSTILHKEYTKPQLIAVLAALVTIIIKEALFRYTRCASTRLESPALSAIAQDHRKDAVTSVATLIGVVGAYLGAELLDPLAAGLTAFFIFHIAWQTFSGAADDLMDCQPPQTFNNAITKLAEEVPGVEHVHEIRCRRSGQYLIIDMKMDMDPAMSVKESHAITATVKRLIFEQFDRVGEVMIHVNPHDDVGHEDLSRL